MSNAPRRLTRNQLADFLPDARSIRAFEQILKQVGDLLPNDIKVIFSAIDNVVLSSAAAESRASQCLDALTRIADALELLASAPQYFQQLGPQEDDLRPLVEVGTLGHQQSDRVNITNGSVVANLTNNQTTLLKSSATLTDGAAASIATLTNSPIAGNPTKWVPINDNGATRYIPTW